MQPSKRPRAASFVFGSEGSRGFESGRAAGVFGGTEDRDLVLLEAREEWSLFSLSASRETRPPRSEERRVGKECRCREIHVVVERQHALLDVSCSQDERSFAVVNYAY